MNLVSREKITKGTLGGRSFLYNPTTFQDMTSVTYNSVKTCGMSYPVPVYGGAEMRTVTFTLYLDDQVEAGVTKSFISHLRSFLPPERAVGYQFVTSKKIRFSYGWFVKDCYLQDLSINYTSVSNTLQPISAEVEVTLIIIS